MRRALFFSFVVAVGTFLIGCGPTEPNRASFPVVTVKGYAQGTTYTIKYVDSAGRDFQSSIDSILKKIDNSVSTYNSNSIVTRFNKADSCTIIDEHVLDLFLMSDEVYQNTDGAFDPTVRPLLKHYGFGPQDDEEEEDPFAIGDEDDFDDGFDDGMEDDLELGEGLTVLKESAAEDIMEYVGWELVLLDGDILYTKMEDIMKGVDQDNYLCKDDMEVELTFDGIAQGYSADVIGSFLTYEKGVKDFLIEIGGEVLTQGYKPNGARWKVQIENPNIDDPNGSVGIATIDMDKFRAVAVSGNYRSFIEQGDSIIGHCVNPSDGWISDSKMISAAVFANDCAIADAYATAFMVMGVNHSIPFVEGNPFEGIEAFFVYKTADGMIETYTSTGLEGLLKTEATQAVQ